MKTIIILGGGVGGIITANQLRKKLGKEHRIIVIDKEEKHLFLSSLLWVINGTRTPSKISRQLSTLNKKGIEFIYGNIEYFDPLNKVVTVNGSKLKADYVVIALGAEISDSLDINNKGYNIYTAAGSEALQKALSEFKDGKLAVLVSSLPFKCPAAPYEAAMLIHSLLLKRGITPKIELYTPEIGPMGVTGKKLSGMLRSIIEAKGIKYFPEHQVTKVEERTLYFNNQTSTNFDIFAYIPKHECPSVIKNTDLVDASGWVKITNSKTLETLHSNIFAIGDITNIPLPQGKPLPKAGVFAHYQAHIVANNIAVEILGKGSFKEFNGDGMCFIELGEGKAGFAKGNFYADPMPKIKMYLPGNHWHFAKVIFEKMFLYKWF